MAKIIVIYLIVILHAAGVIGRLYWTIPYYDKPVHFLGGIWVAMMAAYLLDTYVSKDIFKHHRYTGMVFVVGVTMIVGFGWEFYELLMDLYFFHRPIIFQAGVIDSLTDMLADFFGAVAYALVRFKKFNL